MDKSKKGNDKNKLIGLYDKIETSILKLDNLYSELSSDIVRDDSFLYVHISDIVGDRKNTSVFMCGKGEEDLLWHMFRRMCEQDGLRLIMKKTIELYDNKRKEETI